jgi:hypothetical protein
LADVVKSVLVGAFVLVLKSDQGLLEAVADILLLELGSEFVLASSAVVQIGDLGPIKKFLIALFSIQNGLDTEAFFLQHVK